MNKEPIHPLKVFLCHASGDKPPVRELYKRLTTEGVDAWLDKERLLPGQDWRLEIPKAVQDADVVVICLSNRSITKEGYVQKEIKFALDIAEEKPEGAIFLIPARLEECTVPERLSRWQWVDLYEENGFVQLLRSLKLRADTVGATVEPTSYVDSDKETEHRLEQLYTEGLAAFYTEDWDRACHRFQSILSERPGHKNAAEKLAEANRLRELANLYEQATTAVQSDDWETAIRLLDELSQKSAEYKDAAQLLRKARKEKNLRELYAEAKTLHSAQQWEAVVRVFDQIFIIEPNFQDVKGYLPSAQKEVAEKKRLDELNHQYALALRAMDAGNWLEARRLLETVHKSETGFLETEKLLRKVENEILQDEEKSKQNNEIDTLYEQAHGLLRSKKWRKALDKIEEIGKLDGSFIDTDGIAKKAQKELEREEQEAERQDKLAALYAESVRLLKEEKYQESLDKWQEVKAVDPKYPDRQWVHRTAKRKLGEAAVPIQIRPRLIINRVVGAGVVGLIVIGVVITGVILSGRKNQKVIPTSIPMATRNVMINPTFTMVPFGTNTPRPVNPMRTDTSSPAIPRLTAVGYIDSTMYDDFDNQAFNSGVNTNKWNYFGDVRTVSQENGKLKITLNGFQKGMTLAVNKNYNPVTAPLFIEAKIMLDPGTTTGGTDVGVGFSILDGWSNCSIFADIDKQNIGCWSHTFGVDQKNYSVNIVPGTWHILRVEMYPDTMTMKYIVDGEYMGSYIPRNPASLKNQNYDLRLYFNNWGKSAQYPTSYIDFVRIGLISDDQISQEPFSLAVGEWTAADLNDKSLLTLIINRVSNGYYNVVYRDEKAKVCNNGSGSAEFEVKTISNVISTHMNFICDPPSNYKIRVEYGWTYNRTEDKIIDSYGITWYRKK